MDFFFINAGARTISKNILFDYAVPYPCYVSCASIERNARYYVLLYRFARIVCVFTLSTHWFEWFLVSGFVMFLLFSIHWNVFPFFLYLNHKCVRFAWLNFPYCPYCSWLNWISSTWKLCFVFLSFCCILSFSICHWRNKLPLYIRFSHYCGLSMSYL